MARYHNRVIDALHDRRKRIRVAVKRILKKYGYPPDLHDVAIKTVVQQAEALAAQMAA